MLGFSLLPGPFPRDGDARRRRGNGGTRELATFPLCPWALEKSDLFPPQGDVFVTVDVLSSAGIQVVSKT